MGIVKADLSMSLDGFITGPDAGPEQPLRVGGERLHRWMYDLESWRERHNLGGGEPGPDADVLAEQFADSGAVLMGRRMFESGVGPWGDDPPFRMPVFVVTNHPREPLAKQGGTTYIFVDGPDRALAEAKAAAGEADVSVAGGANVVQGLLRAGLLDQIQLHVVPVFLGKGRRLFDGAGLERVELERDRVIDSPGVTHLRYRVVT